jgi:AcrR family transcriptional regulator
MPVHDPAASRPDPRTGEILDRIKGVFAAKGFDGASMQDLARAAGMSAGNFYRYFPSKDAIVAAMVERDLAELEADFSAIIGSAQPRAALMARLARRLEEAARDGALWAEIEAAAARRPEIGAIHARMMGAVMDYLMRCLARIAGVPEAEAAHYAPHATLMILLVHGVAVSACCTPRPAGMLPAADLRALVLRVVDRLLDEIAARSDGLVPAGG